MEKLIVTAAVTGALTMREQNPNVPYTPEEIARAAIDSWKAGAAMAHLHVRDPLTGEGRQETELFREVIRLIRSECDIIVNVTTGASPGISFDQRIAIVPELSSDLEVKPDMASLNCGSLNFDILSRKQRRFLIGENGVHRNPWNILLRYADIMKECGVKPELEIYEAGMINNAMVLESLDALKKPLHFSFVLGVLGAMQSTTDNLMFLKNSIPDQSTWSVCGVGLSIFRLAPVAIATGGHVRVGLEDCAHVAEGVLAASSAQMVEKIVRMANEIGREIATPTEARKVLSL